MIIASFNNKNFGTQKSIGYCSNFKLSLGHPNGKNTGPINSAKEPPGK